MIQVFPDATLVPWLKRGVSPTLYYWLYGNNYTPVAGSVVGSFSLMAGAAYQSVDVADFTLESTAGHIGRITAADLVFTNADGVSHDAYGYFVTDAQSGGSPSGNLVTAARFDSAPVSIPPGGTYNVVPTFGDAEGD